jgi:Family of unknown function (DUF5906)
MNAPANFDLPERTAEIVTFVARHQLPLSGINILSGLGGLINGGPQIAAAKAKLREIAARQKAEIERHQPPLGSVGAAKVPQPDGDEPEPQAKVPPLPISDFIAHSPDHSYIYRPTGEEWTSTAVNARVMPVPIGRGIKALPANVWLDRNDPVEQRTWAPGEPQIIEDKLVAEGGFFAKRGARVFNLYKPPQIMPSINRDIRLWRDHLHALWPSEADHITLWFAHRVQRPGEKINHALVPGGDQGIGKDAVIAPLKRAVGSWNFAEISPQEALGVFNEFRRSVVLRISEGKDLGDIDRFAFYDGTKTLIASPPETLRVNPKFVKPYYVINVTGVIITTNHKVGGLFLPPDDRRHFVAWSTIERSAFNEAYWGRYWKWLDAGGAAAVAQYLRTLDISAFNPKAPPPRTQAFYEMVNAMRPERESDMEDIIDHLDLPDALLLRQIVSRARTLDRHEFAEWLKDGAHGRQIALMLEDCGYRRLSNPLDGRGRWKIGGKRVSSLYVRKSLTDREAFAAVDAIREM